jgi:hypothetical protein
MKSQQGIIIREIFIQAVQKPQKGANVMSLQNDTKRKWIQERKEKKELSFLRSIWDELPIINLQHGVSLA